MSRPKGYMHNPLLPSKQEVTWRISAKLEKLMRRHVKDGTWDRYAGAYDKIVERLQEDSEESWRSDINNRKGGCYNDEAR